MTNTESPLYVLTATIETISSDCDGLMSRGQEVRQTTEEATAEFGDILFHERILNMVANTYSGMGGTLVVEKGSDPVREDLPEWPTDWTRLYWNETTDEGYTATTALIVSVEADDEPDDYWQRDHQAEAAGY